MALVAAPERVSRRSLLVAGAFVALVAVLQPGHDAVGASKNKAGIVVRSSDGSVDEMCVFFDEPSISGVDLLDRAGVTYISERSAVGSAICRIDGKGCRSPSEKCFCEFPTFWGYWVRDPDDSAWTFASVGAADREVRDGSIDGWSWGQDGKPSPPKAAFEDVCAASNVVSPASAKRVEPISRRQTDVSFNAGGFVLFALIFVLAGVGVVALRRRRRA